MGRFKNEMGDNLKLCLRQIMQMNNKDPDSLLLEDPVRRFLIDEFRTANKRGDDRFTAKEFNDVVKALELGFDDYELGEIFSKADSDKTGLASLLNCVNAVSQDRGTELTFRVLFSTLADELGVSVGYRSSSKRRNIAKRTAFLQFEALTTDLTTKLINLLDVGVEMDDERKFYDNLRDAFNAFDADGSGELSYNEFKEVCKFLGKPTSESEISALFQAADTDRSGILDFDEVASAIMGEAAAQKHGLMNSLTKANDLVDSVSGAFASFKGSLAELGASADERAREKRKSTDCVAACLGTGQGTQG
eukprot:TRINITY_DN1383_c0_g1_i2.p1 TRINITY_DN1383_c0_g1~~TRINITY_DN1383_c0_g1_i2.p1  ORF type:complete len:306 (+),score=85.22 TRINITY_DN1383_c0_g1_i2:388-1305(+)